MTKATRRKVSYVIKSGNEEHAHRLGVNSLALDTATANGSEGTPGGILYSASRDGVVAAWDLHFNFKRKGIDRENEALVDVANGLLSSVGGEDDDDVSLGRLASDKWRLNTESTTVCEELS